MPDLEKNESYFEFVSKHIELDKILYNLPKDKQIQIKKLLDKRNILRKSNSLFAEYKINKINKKINKIKIKYSV